jgi:hypothetical protein
LLGLSAKHVFCEYSVCAATVCDSVLVLDFVVPTSTSVSQSFGNFEFCSFQQFSPSTSLIFSFRRRCIRLLTLFLDSVFLCSLTPFSPDNSFLALCAIVNYFHRFLITSLVPSFSFFLQIELTVFSLFSFSVPTLNFCTATLTFLPCYLQ